MNRSLFFLEILTIAILFLVAYSLVTWNKSGEVKGESQTAEENQVRNKMFDKEKTISKASYIGKPPFFILEPQSSGEGKNFVSNKKHQPVNHDTQANTLDAQSSSKPTAQTVAQFTSLKVFDDGKGDITIIFDYENLNQMEVKYSLVPLKSEVTDDEWQSLLDVPIYSWSDVTDGRAIIAGHVAVDGEYFLAVGTAETNQVISLNLQNTKQVMPYSVLISEVAWMGSSVAALDEWLVLQNMTDKKIDVSGWIVENLAGVSDFILPENTVIEANGEFLISNYDSESRRSILGSLDRLSQLVSSSVQLSNTGEQLVLRDTTGQVIDSTPVADTGWVKGENIPGDNIHKPMVRKSWLGKEFALQGLISQNWQTSTESF